MVLRFRAFHRAGKVALCPMPSPATLSSQSMSSLGRCPGWSWETGFGNRGPPFFYLCDWGICIWFHRSFSVGLYLSAIHLTYEKVALREAIFFYNVSGFNASHNYCNYNNFELQLVFLNIFYLDNFFNINCGFRPNVWYACITCT